MCKRKTAVHNNPLHLLMQIEEYGLTDNSIIVVDGGDFVGSASYILRPRGPLSWLDPGAFGTLGVGAGFAIGAKLCRPEATVWIIYGDGSCAYSISEMDTMRRHNLPAIAVIGNDAAWSQIARDQVKLLSTNIACELAYLPYHTVGAAYACKEAAYPSEAEGAFLVTKETSEEQFKNTLMSCIQLSHEGIPSTINCLIGSTDFREGSISC